MFGYIEPHKPSLKICEYELYKSVYCGLCRQLGKYNKRLKLILSFDMAFYTLLSLSLKDCPPDFETSHCILNPFKEKNFLKDNHDLKLASNLSVILFYFKIKDNIVDEKKFKKWLGYLSLLLIKSAKKKAVVNLNEGYEIVKEMNLLQTEMEKRTFVSVDTSCDPFASSMSNIFCLMSDNEKTKIPLKKLGYMIGRYIYIMDAYNDIEEDIKSKNFNPLIKKYDIKSKEDIINNGVDKYTKEVINITIAQLSSAYELLPIKRFKPILDNIIYLGLKSKLNKLIIEENGITLNKIIKTKKNKEVTNGQSI